MKAGYAPKYTEFLQFVIVICIIQKTHLYLLRKWSDSMMANADVVKLLPCLTRRWHEQTHGRNICYHCLPLLLEMGQMSGVCSTTLIYNCTQTAVNYTGYITSSLEWATLEMYIFTSTGCGDVQIRVIKDRDTNIQISSRQLNNVLIESKQQCSVPLVFHCVFDTLRSICPSTVRRMTSGRWQWWQTKNTLIFQ